MKHKRFEKKNFHLRTLILFILLGSTSLCTSVYSQTTKVTLNIRNGSVENVISELEKKTNYTFLYKNEIFRNKNNNNLLATNKPLNEILNDWLSPLSLQYTIDDNVIIITESNFLQQKTSTRKITGKIVDDNNLPLIGVSVKLQEGGIHVISDIDGNYSISIPAKEGQVLSFSYLGMETKEISVTNNNVFNVVLIPSSVGLNDIVIEGGYGLAQKRSDMVGSAYQVNSEQIKNLPPIRIDNMLEGLVPGLSINFNSDSDANTRPRLSARVRGDGSLSAGQEPIWIIDGVRINTGGNTNLITGLETSISPLSYINPNDIESFTVLKDASAVSLYGANGSNGVILVTTKKGKAGKLTISAGVRFGISQINENQKFKILNGEQYMTLAKEAYRNRYAEADPDMKFFPFQDLPNNSYSTTNTDWYDQFYKKGSSQEYTLSMRGGSENIKNYISASYFQSDGTVRGNNQERFSLRANVDIKLHEKLTMGINTSFSYNVNDIFSPGNDYYTYLPIISPYNEDGSYRLYYDYIENKNGIPTIKSSRFFNSLPEREENDNKQRTLANMTTGSLKYNVIDGLLLTGEFGLDYTSALEETYNAMTNWSGRNTLDGGKEVGYATRNSANSLNWNAILRLNFDKTFGKHTIGALLATEAQSDEDRYVMASGNTFANDHIKEVSFAVNRKGSSGQSTSHVASFLGQVSYSFDKRYYLTLNTRRDGSSDFGEDVKWAQFGSVGASWNIHNEKFFKSKLIDVLKIKGSYGTSGNSRTSDIKARGIYSYGNNYNGQAGSVMSSIKNRKLSWETAYIANLGLRIRFLERFDFEVEVYNKITDDMISNSAISMVTGQTTIDANIAKMKNNGIEVNIESINIDSKNFKWTTSLNVAHNSNKILSLYVPRLGSTNKVWMEGYDKNTWNLVRWAGVNPRDGSPLWYDAQGNVTNVYSESYAVPYKRSTPDLEGGIMNSLAYKDFSLGIIMTYNIGGYAFSTFSRSVASDGHYNMEQNISVNELDRWQKPGDIALSPLPVWGNSPYSIRNSTRYLFNKTHLRLKNITLAYKLPSNYLRQMGFSNGDISIIVDNIAIWSPYSKSGRNTYAQSMSGYPLEISYSLGLNLRF